MYPFKLFILFLKTFYTIDLPIRVMKYNRRTILSALSLAIMLAAVVPGFGSAMQLTQMANAQAQNGIQTISSGDVEQEQNDLNIGCVIAACINFADQFQLAVATGAAEVEQEANRVTSDV